MSRENVELVLRVLDQARHKPPRSGTSWMMRCSGKSGLSTFQTREGHGTDPRELEFFRRWVGPFDDWSYEFGK